MAQLNGVMAADFSDFHFEIDKSIVKLKDLEGATGRTGGAIDDFEGGLNAVDKTLGLFGIRIGPQIQALREFSGVLGKTTSELGTWGTAAAAAASFAAGWKIGELIADWTGLGDAIAHATTSLLGWGDAGLEATKAKIDLLARASNLAGREIKDFDEALKIVKESNRAMAESLNTGAERVRQWKAEIAAVTAKGDLPAITQELKNQTSTLKEISEHYGISTRALEYYNRTLSDSTKAQKAWADEARPRYDAIRQAQEELTHATGGWHQTLLTITPAVAKHATEALNMGVAQGTVAKALNLSALQVDALDRQMQLNLATMAATEPALGSLDEWIKTNTADTQAYSDAWRFTSEVIDTQVIPSLEAIATTAQQASSAVAAAVPAAAGGGPTYGSSARWGQGSSAPTPIDVGNIVLPLGLERTFEEYSKKAGAGGGMLGGFIGGGPPKDFLTWALQAGLAQRGPAVTNTFNIVDTESGIARRVGETITSQLQRGSLVN